MLRQKYSDKVSFSSDDRGVPYIIDLDNYIIDNYSSVYTIINKRPNAMYSIYVSIMDLNTYLPPTEIKGHVITFLICNNNPYIFDNNNKDENGINNLLPVRWDYIFKYHNTPVTGTDLVFCPVVFYIYWLTSMKDIKGETPLFKIILETRPRLISYDAITNNVYLYLDNGSIYSIKVNVKYEINIEKDIISFFKPFTRYLDIVLFRIQGFDALYHTGSVSGSGSGENESKQKEAEVIEINLTDLNNILPTDPLPDPQSVLNDPSPPPLYPVLPPRRLYPTLNKLGGAKSKKTKKRGRKVKRQTRHYKKRF